MLAFLSYATSLNAQSTAVFDVTRPPGANFDKAEFRLWIPQNLAQIRAVMVLIPGSNGDGRPEVNDAVWQRFAGQSAAHVVGRSREIALAFFEDVLPLRLPELSAISESSGFLGDLKAKTFQKQTGPAPNYPTAWLPTARVARMWEAMVNEKPFEP